MMQVGTKSDLRNSDGKGVTAVITEAQGKQRAVEMGAVEYMECSALTQSGLKDVFQRAIRAGLMRTYIKPRNKCVIL